MLYVGVLGALAIVALLFFSKEGPEMVASKFMSALVEGNPEELTKLSYYPAGTEKELKERWVFSTKVAGRYYVFSWNIKFAKQADENTAGVAMEVTRNAQNQMSYPENYQLPLVKKDGKWLVDVSSISREMYPAMPQ
jgi:hypothetical protein